MKLNKRVNITLQAYQRELCRRFPKFAINRLLKISQVSQNWANNIAARGQMCHSQGSGYGENIFGLAVVSKMVKSLWIIGTARSRTTDLEVEVFSIIQVLYNFILINNLEKVWNFIKLESRTLYTSGLEVVHRAWDSKSFEQKWNLCCSQLQSTWKLSRTV